jgi:hypothetical protein
MIGGIEMRNRRLMICAAVLIVLSVGTNAFSQKAGNRKRARTEIMDVQDKRAQIRRLLQLMGSGKAGAQMMNQMFGTMRRTARDVPEQVWRDLIEEFKNEFSPEAIIELSVPIYDKYYSYAEIQQLIAFYESPIGRKVTTVLPMLLQDSYAAGVMKGQEVLQKIIEKLKSKGYQVPVS